MPLPRRTPGSGIFVWGGMMDGLATATNMRGRQKSKKANYR